MKLDRQKLELAMARACMNTVDLVEVLQIPRPTFNSLLRRQTGSPKTFGMIATALHCDVLDILADEEKEE